MIKKIGISVYPEMTSEAETIEYIKKAKKYGINRIFASLLKVQNNERGRQIIVEKTRVFKVAKDLGFDIILDVAPGVYKEFKIPQDDLTFFHDMNVTGIRLDEDFGGEVEAKLSHNKHGLKIELNASSKTSTVTNAIRLGADKSTLCVCHNFYPMEFTGLKYDRFIKMTKYFYDQGIRTASFVTLPRENKGVGPWINNDGMPSIEEHRNMPLKNQIKHYLAMGFISDIIISQQAASDEQLKELSELIKDPEKTIFEVSNDIKIQESEQKVLDYKKHFNRSDVNGYFIRSTMTRVIYKDEVIKPRKYNGPRKVGQVFIANDLFERYKGELHIVTKEMPHDERVNLIGEIDKFDHNLLEFVGPNSKLQVVKKLK